MAFRTPTDLPSFPADTTRPQFAGSPLIQAVLEKALLMARSDERIAVVTPASVDLGALVPQEILGDGTEIWGPAEDSPLAGTIKVRVRNGQVVSQEVLSRNGRIGH